MITAHHEAGHAVASVICNGTVYKIDIDGTDHLSGVTHHGTHCSWQPYVIYGGVWAEARLRFHSTDRRFASEVTAVFAEQSGHASSDGPAFKAAVRETGWGREPSWDAQLETYWPVTQRVAALLLAGAVGVESRIPALMSTR